MSATTQFSRPSLEHLSSSRRLPQIHWFFTAMMAVLVLPMFRLADVPLQVDILGMSVAYWWATASRALFMAVVLSLFCFPYTHTLAPVLRHYSEQKLRLPFLGLLSCWLIYLLGWSLGLMLVVDTIAVAELLDRDLERIRERTLDILVPAVYLFLGLVLVFALNHAIAAAKFAGGWDGFFNNLDARVLGITVSDAAEWGKNHLPRSLWWLAGLAYYNVYGQIGGALVILALAAGRGTAVRFVGVTLTAYVFALALFFLMPSMGPFALREAHEKLPAWGQATSRAQKSLPIQARLIRNHAPVPELMRVSLADYYIGFPSMHVAMPVIALCFLHRYRRLFWLLLAFDLFLVTGIVILEWHFFVDIVGGAAVATLAFLLNSDGATQPAEGRY